MRHNGTEAAREKYLAQVGLYLEEGLPQAVARQGGIFTGMTVKWDEFETLVIMRADFPGNPMVAFVSGADMAYCVRQAYQKARQDLLKWKVDKYRSTVDTLE